MAEKFEENKKEKDYLSDNDKYISNSKPNVDVVKVDGQRDLEYNRSALESIRRAISLSFH
jgi:hypothetical protein